MNQSSLLAEFGDPITRVENALLALKEGMMKIVKTKATLSIPLNTLLTHKWR